MCTTVIFFLYISCTFPDFPKTQCLNLFSAPLQLHVLAHSIPTFGGHWAFIPACQIPPTLGTYLCRAQLGGSSTLCGADGAHWTVHLAGGLHSTVPESFAHMSGNLVGVTGKAVLS